jgi:hypothetical protein
MHFAAFSQLFQVANQRAVQIIFRFHSRAAIADTTRHVGGIGQVAGPSLFDDDQVFFHNAVPRPPGAKILATRDIWWRNSARPATAATLA